MHNISMNLTRISRVRFSALLIARAGYTGRSSFLSAIIEADSWLKLQISQVA